MADKNNNLFSHSSGDQNFHIRILAGLMSSESEGESDPAFLLGL